jgi:hypothetical protein
VARIDEMRNAYKILVGRPEGKRSLGRPSCSGKMVLECILGKQGGEVRTGCIRFRIDTSDGLL